MYKKFWFWWIILLVLLVGSVIVYIRSRSGNQDQDQDQDQDPEQALQNDQEQIDTNNRLLTAYNTVYDTIQQHTGQSNPVLAVMLTAQAAHETGDFTSMIYRMNHNLFGMRQPVKRDTTSIAALNGYASYTDDSQSVVDRLLYADYVNEPVTASVVDFVDFLKEKSYFEDSKTNYKKGVTAWALRLNDLLKGG